MCSWGRGKTSTAGSNGIQIVTADHDFIGQIGTYNSARRNDGPTSIVLDEDENLYLADEFYHRITKFDRDGNAITSWERKGLVTVNLINPAEC